MTIICALDTSDIDLAKKLIVDLYGDIRIFKIGLEYFINNGSLGMNAIGAITMHNDKSSAELPGTYWITPEIFLDLKLHDIPKTIHGAVAGLHSFLSRGQNITMTTVHAAGGVEMMREAVEAADKKFDIIAVTLLTSIADKSATKIVLKRTEDALNAGVSGVVCSPKEVKILRKKFGNDFKIVVPGIRPLWYKADDDQERTGTPKQVIENGGDFLVIGRPITSSTSPIDAVQRIKQEL